MHTHKYAHPHTFFYHSRNAIFSSVAHSTIRKISRNVFEHLHTLDMNFHLSRSTGVISRVIDRGSRSINFALTSIVFNVIPTLLEVGLVSGILVFSLGAEYALIAATTVGTYTVFTVKVSNWRTKIRQNMNKYENAVGGKALDSLINYGKGKNYSIHNYMMNVVFLLQHTLT